MNDNLLKVFEFEVFDAAQHRWKRAERQATESAIKAAGGIPIMSSALLVDAARVDENGFLKSASIGMS